MKTSLAVKCLLGLLLWFFSVVSAHAVLAIYSFDAPDFSLGETSPLLNRSPIFGLPPSFLADFTVPASPNSFTIDQFFQTSPINGPSLVTTNLSPPSFPLTITLNTPVDGVWLSFYMLPAGRLELTSSSGVTSALTGPFSQTGSLNFTSAVPFSQFTLAAFDHYGSNGPLAFGIDNLQMNVVPEPAAYALWVGMAAAMMILLRRRVRPVW